MKAAVYENYGTPDVIQIDEIDLPEPTPNEIRVKVKAVSLNSSDWEFLTGYPLYTRAWGLRKPHIHILGSDIAGVVDAVGSNATKFKLGDKVFGDIFEHWGGFAEYVCVPEKMLTQKPDFLSFEEAAAVPQSGLIALQGLKEKGEIQADQKVLINGAGGGAGSFAIQLAKFYGAEVTAVDHTDKLEMMNRIGADYVIDYTKFDFTKNNQQYHIILDLVASHSILDYKRALTSCGKYIMVGGSLSYVIKTLFLASMISMSGSRKMGILAHKPNKDIKFLIDLLESKRIKPIIDKIYSFEQLPDALNYLGAGKVKGKVVVSMDDNLE